MQSVLTDASGCGAVGGRDLSHGEVLLQRPAVPHVRHARRRHRRLHPLVLLLLAHAPCIKDGHARYERDHVHMMRAWGGIPKARVSTRGG